MQMAEYIERERARHECKHFSKGMRKRRKIANHYCVIYLPQMWPRCGGGSGNVIAHT